MYKLRPRKLRAYKKKKKKFTETFAEMEMAEGNVGRVQVAFLST